MSNPQNPDDENRITEHYENNQADSRPTDNSDEETDSQDHHRQQHCYCHGPVQQIAYPPIQPVAPVTQPVVNQPWYSNDFLRGVLSGFGALVILLAAILITMFLFGRPSHWFGGLHHGHSMNAIKANTAASATVPPDMVVTTTPSCFATAPQYLENWPVGTNFPCGKVIAYGALYDGTDHTLAYLPIEPGAPVQRPGGQPFPAGTHYLAITGSSVDQINNKVKIWTDMLEKLHFRLDP